MNNKKYNTIILIILSFFCACTGRKSNLFILFDQIDGLPTGAEVSSRGSIIGKVTDITLVKNGVLVAIEVDEKVNIPIGSSIKLINENPVQDKLSVQIIFSNSERYYTQSDTIFINNAGVNDNDKALPVNLDSATQTRMINVFEKIDTIINVLREKK